MRLNRLYSFRESTEFGRKQNTQKVIIYVFVNKTEKQTKKKIENEVR